MNILVINWRDIKHPEAGGAEVHFQNIFGRLAAAGHSVHLLTTRFRGADRTDHQDGMTIHRWGNTWLFNWQSPFFVRKLVRRHAIDVVIDDMNKLPFFSHFWQHDAVTLVFYHHLFGKTIFGLAWYPLALYVLVLERLSVRMYRTIPCCTVSQSTATELVRLGFRKDRITIIENSVDTEALHPSPTVRTEPDLLVYIGRLMLYKNLSLLLSVLRRLHDEGRALRLIIAGTGSYESHLRDEVRRLNLSSHVSFAGFVDEDRKPELLQRAVLFVNPSLKEGWGISNIEANACGTAVVANNAPGLRDSVRHEETGLLYHENDPDDLRRCIIRLLDNPDERRHLEKKAREWALHFSWDNSARRVMEWIQAAALSRDKPGPGS